MHDFKVLHRFIESLQHRLRGLDRFDA